MRFLLSLLLFTFSLPALAATPSANGSWTYRSFLNDPIPVGDDPNKLQALLFGEGILSLQVAAEGSVSGLLSFGPTYNMDVSGSFTPGTSDALSLRAKGRAGTPTAGWIYDYKATLAPVWSNAVNQVPAYLGTVIRTVPHNGGPAGVTASFIMVKH